MLTFLLQKAKAKCVSRPFHSEVRKVQEANWLAKVRVRDVRPEQR
jgi:hypothetical protein